MPKKGRGNVAWTSDSAQGQQRTAHGERDKFWSLDDTDDCGSAPKRHRRGYREQDSAAVQREFSSAISLLLPRMFVRMKSNCAWIRTFENGTSTCTRFTDLSRIKVSFLRPGMC